jgi:hypothetical protein
MDQENYRFNLFSKQHEPQHWKQDLLKTDGEAAHAVILRNPPYLAWVTQIFGPVLF